MTVAIPSTPISLELLLAFEPKESWLAHESLIHGVGHLTRVVILQELIATELEKQGIAIDRLALRWAAATHDVGRHDDGYDLEHGTRSAQWITDNLGDQMNIKSLETAAYAVHWHVPPDKQAPAMTPELTILKDADGLDRARLGDLDPSYLRTDAARSLIETAKELYTLSSPSDGTQETFVAVVKAAQQLGLVETISKGNLVS